MSETQICVHYDLPTDDVMLLYLIQKPGDATKLSCLLLSGFHVIYLYISFFCNYSIFQFDGNLLQN